MEFFTFFLLHLEKNSRIHRINCPCIVFVDPEAVEHIYLIQEFLVFNFWSYEVHGKC